jgi:hypothetical protein
LPEEKGRRPSRRIEIRTTAPPPGKYRDFNLSRNIKFQEFFISQRGEFLNASVEAENQLAFIIQVVLSREIADASLFRTIVLDRLAFRQKIEVFVELLKNVPQLEPLSTNYKKLPGHLQSLNTIRNKYAHGKLFFREDTPYLEFFKGKVREEAISKERIEADLRKVSGCKEEPFSFADDLVALVGTKGGAKPRAEGS